MIQIKDIIVPTKGVGKYFQISALGFPMNPETVSFYWQVFAQSDNAPSICILDGNLLMDQTTYEGWGNNDEYVNNWACKELNLEII